MNLKTIKVLLFTLLALTLASFLRLRRVKPVYFLFGAVRHRLQPSGCCAGAAPSAANASAATADLPALRQSLLAPVGTRPEWDS
ncbi:MAG: hypothetical protein ACLTZF_01625 [Oscillospiraceae bacterium]